MSCIRFNTAAQRTAMRDNRPQMISGDELIWPDSALGNDSADPHRAQHPIPAVTASKIRRLHLLATDSNPKIRESAASSPNVTPELFEILSTDDHEGVRSCVARNERATAEILRRLAVDESDRVRGFVALNHYVPEDVLQNLASDRSETVRSLVEWKRTAATSVE